jgi:hypothetical protein
MQKGAHVIAQYAPIFFAVTIFLASTTFSVHLSEEATRLRDRTHHLRNSSVSIGLQQ